MWLVEKGIANKIEKAEKENFKPSAEQELEFSALHDSDSEDLNPRHLRIVGDTAEISIKGALSNSPSILAMIFGGGNITYPEIISALAIAGKNPDVSNIILAVDSPGGNVDGLFEVYAAIAQTEKPIKAVVSNKALSAAYGLVAQTDEIIAKNETTQFGSVGVLTQYLVNPDVVTITSTKSPKKAPDVTTKEGKATVLKFLDTIHDAFVAVIARGRNVTPATVNADFGQGGVLLAKEAKEKGMIDSISNPVIQVKTGPAITDKFKPSASAIGNTNEDKVIKEEPNKQTNREVRTMDLQKFKLENPTIFAEAVELGVKNERDRVLSHLKMTEASGDIKTTMEAIEAGSELTNTILATHHAAQINANSVEARKLDNPEGNDTDTTASGAGEDAGSVVASKVEELMGTNTGGAV